jgi:hypothetical protein
VALWLSCSLVYPSCSFVGRSSHSLDLTHLHSDRYSLTYSRDPWLITLTVYGCFALDAFQSMIVAVRNWYLLVGGWGRPVAIIELNWTFCAISPVTGIRKYLPVCNRRYVPPLVIMVSFRPCCFMFRRRPFAVEYLKWLRIFSFGKFAL